MKDSYNKTNPITKNESADLKKVATYMSSSSSQYKNSKGQVFTITDIITGKVSGDDAKAVSTAGSAGEIGSLDYGIKNVRDAKK
jgi:hypothetical protein